MGRRAKSTAILRQSFASRTSTTETQSATPSMLSAISTFVPAPVITGTSTSEQEVDFGGYDQLHVQTPQSWLLPPFPRSADPPFTNLPNLSAPPFSMPEPENLLGQYTNAPAASSAPAPINGFWDTPAGQSFAVPSNQSNGSTAAYNPFWMFQNAPNVEQTSNNFTQLPAPIDIPIAQPSDPRAAQAPQIDSQTIPLTLNTPSPCSQAAAAASIPAEPVYLKMTPISSSHLDAQGNPMNFVDWCSANHKVAPPDGAIYPVFPRIAWDSHTKALFNQFTSTTHPLLPHYSPSVNRCLSKLAAATTFPELATAFVGQRLASVCDVRVFSLDLEILTQVRR